MNHSLDQTIISSSLNLEARTSPGAQVSQTSDNAWRLLIPPGDARQYRLAQLDDYHSLGRHALPWQPPISFSLEAQVSSRQLAGTWGFGWWNDPFSFTLGLGGGERRLPALPNAAWYFYASIENYLSFQDDLPVHGQTATVFQSPKWPTWLVAASVGALPLLTIPFMARWLRRLLRRLIRQSSVALAVSPTTWQHYQIDWFTESVVFKINGKAVLVSPQAPVPPLGMVIWIDNQYAAFTPSGKFRFGNLATPDSQWLEIRNPVISTPNR